MVVLDVKVCGEDKKLYMDGNLHHQLIKYVKPSVQKRDFDHVLVVDGEEGSGKSTFAFQLAKILDPNFNLSKVCFTPDEFINAVTSAKKHECIVYDECGTGLSSRSSLSEVNILLVNLMMEMRSRNLFVILVMPTYYMLDKYCVLHRAKGLFHIYLRDGRRGYWTYFNKQRMKKLYLQGKKTYDYNGVRYLFFGRFRGQYMVDETKYRARKRKVLEGKRRITKSDVFKWQRDVVFEVLYENYEGNIQKIAVYVIKRGISLIEPP